VRKVLTGIASALALFAAACESEPRGREWQVVHSELPAALFSVWGSASDDVWAVGADPDDGEGPLVLHFDGAQWTRHVTGVTGNLWWVFGFAGGPVYMGGERGTILRYDGSSFESMTTPGTATVFGIWGAAPDDVWAVGGGAGGSSGAFAWRLSGDTWSDAAGFPAELAATDAVWKVFGRARDDVWMVGTNGLALHHDGTEFTQPRSATTRSLFTVHGNGDRLVAVGGFGTGTLVEHDGTGWRDATPIGAVQLIGVCVSDDAAYAVGTDGMVYRDGGDGWEIEPHRTRVIQPLHAVWIDPDGGAWAVGGQVLSEPFVNGVMIHEGAAVPGGL